MIQSGLIQVDDRLNNVTGVLVELPFFDQLDYIEENVDSSSTWGTVTPGSGRYTTQKHTASTQYAPFVTRGAAFAADMLHQYETGEQAINNITAQLQRKMNTDITKKVVAQFNGMFETALAANSLNIATKAGEEPDESNYLTASTVTAAKYLLGENAADVSILVVHPLVVADMEARGMLSFVNSGGTVNYASNAVGVTDTRVKYFGGLRIVADGQVPVTTPKSATTGDALSYTCYLAAPGVLKTGRQFELKIEQDRDILSLQDVMSVTYSQIHHVLGTTYKGSMHPENSDLADASSWEMAYSSNENIKLVEVVVNTPFGKMVP